MTTLSGRGLTASSFRLIQNALDGGRNEACAVEILNRIRGNIERSMDFALGIRIETTRTRLKVILQKTGTSRQSQLMLLLSRLNWQSRAFAPECRLSETP
ncbi:hypothetical protein ACG873_10870 [Mesorhizobium sp. AaZ16]|uniref:hypothetical protein n=1 Tax=Mesorhizobium sp. AaZ16 TaxID=3402289 RepID=UPI00374EAB9F